MHTKKGRQSQRARICHYRLARTTSVFVHARLHACVLCVVVRAFMLMCAQNGGRCVACMLVAAAAAAALTGVDGEAAAGCALKSKRIQFKIATQVLPKSSMSQLWDTGYPATPWCVAVSPLKSNTESSLKESLGGLVT
jgi:hypothetical protein